MVVNHWALLSPTSPRTELMMVVSPVRCSQREKKPNIDPEFVYEEKDASVIIHSDNESQMTEDENTSLPPSQSWFSTFISTPVKRLRQSLLGSPISSINNSIMESGWDMTSTPVLIHPPSPSTLLIPETQADTSTPAERMSPPKLVIPDSQPDLRDKSGQTQFDTDIINVTSEAQEQTIMELNGMPNDKTMTNLTNSSKGGESRNRKKTRKSKTKIEKGLVTRRPTAQSSQL